jgi:hypothetical protein
MRTCDALEMKDHSRASALEAKPDSPYDVSRPTPGANAESQSAQQNQGAPAEGGDLGCRETA